MADNPGAESKKERLIEPKPQPASLSERTPRRSAMGAEMADPAPRVSAVAAAPVASTRNRPRQIWAVVPKDSIALIHMLVAPNLGVGTPC